MDTTNRTRGRTRGRYEVRDANGLLHSSHRTAAAAARSAARLARSLGLVDDGTYCSSDGWPAIIDTIGEGRVDYD